MISKTIGFRGLAYFQTHPNDENDVFPPKIIDFQTHPCGRCLACPAAAEVNVASVVKDNAAFVHALTRVPDPKMQIWHYRLLTGAPYLEAEYRPFKEPWETSLMGYSGIIVGIGYNLWYLVDIWVCLKIG